MPRLYRPDAVDVLAAVLFCLAAVFRPFWLARQWWDLTHEYPSPDDRPADDADVPAAHVAAAPKEYYDAVKPRTRIKKAFESRWDHGKAGDVPLSGR